MKEPPEVIYMAAAQRDNGNTAKINVFMNSFLKFR